MISEKKIIGVLLVLGIVLFLIPVAKEVATKRKDICLKRISVIIITAILILLFSKINMTSNGVCQGTPKPQQIVKNVKEAYCSSICYCDGFMVHGQCVGSWQKVCPFQ